MPVWAERGGTHTPWHPEHIAERYGLFTIIVLGETILSSSVAFQAVVDERTGDVTAVLTAVGALTHRVLDVVDLLRQAGRAASSSRSGSCSPGATATSWSSASAAAVGAGVAVMVDSVTGRAAHLRHRRGGAFTIPVILYLVAITFIQTLLYGVYRDRLGALLVALACVGAATFTGSRCSSPGSCSRHWWRCCSCSTNDERASH